MYFLPPATCKHPSNRVLIPNVALKARKHTRYMGIYIYLLIYYCHCIHTHVHVALEYPQHTQHPDYPEAREQSVG